MPTDHTPKLQFSFPFDDRTAEEAAGGYWGHSYVEFSDGRKHPVVFYDAVRLAQDLHEEALQGRPFIAEHGMIVVQGVTRANMTVAVERLASEGFFD
jgi:hypothetical protein